MSSIGGISSLLCFKLFLDETNNPDTTFRKKWGFLGASVASVLVCFLGASRAALGATFVALFFYLWFYLGNVGKFMKYLIVALFLVVISSPVWYPYTEKVREKTEARNAMGGQFSSRDDMWNARKAEFESNPVLGIGFSSVDLKKSSDSVRANGGIEPGTSWLFMLSSVGLIRNIILCHISTKTNNKVYVQCKKVSITIAVSDNFIGMAKYPSFCGGIYYGCR